MAQSNIEIRSKRAKRQKDVAPSPAPAKRSKDLLDNPEAQRRFTKVLEWRRQAQQAQTQNRYEMAVDEDFFDGDQWTEDDKAELEARGQAALVFNLIATTVRWVTGTEKRTRVDYRVMARHDDGTKDAENKTKLLKYLTDVNRTGFARSKAFEQTVKAGVGWLEQGIRSDESEEPLFVRWESWRNVWYDPLSVEPDMSDARFLFREKWVDLDVAQAMFPQHAEALKHEAENISDPNQLRTETSHNKYLYGDEELVTTYSQVGDLVDMGSRDRVKLVECWYGVPGGVKVLRGVDEEMERHSFSGKIFNSADPVHAWAVQHGYASTYDAIRMQMRLMMYCGSTLLQDAPSPYWHNRFPLTPIWGYRRSRDNAPYGIVRGLRDPQEDLNKRRSKALLLLSTNQIIADDDAVNDWDDTLQEVARPDGVVRKKRGSDFQIRNQATLAPMHVQLMDQDARYIQESAGVTDENLGRQSNAISGKAIEARQNQGYTSTSDLFDNLRLAVQLSGEIQLSLIEQYYDQEKVFRLTGERGNAEYTKINTGPDDQITARQADFMVDEQDYRGTIRQAMFDTMLEMTSKLPPEVGLKLLTIAFEMSDVPMREEFVRVLREATGMTDPNEELTPEEEAARQQQQEQQMALQERQIKAQLALLEGKAKEAMAKGDKAQMEKLMKKLEALKASMEIAGGVAANPQLAQAADQIMRDVEGVNNVAPPLPAGVQ
jgi:hypothetical protein